MPFDGVEPLPPLEIEITVGVAAASGAGPDAFFAFTACWTWAAVPGFARKTRTTGRIGFASDLCKASLNVPCLADTSAVSAEPHPVLGFVRLTAFLADLNFPGGPSKQPADVDSIVRPFGNLEIQRSTIGGMASCVASGSAAFWQSAGKSPWLRSYICTYIQMQVCSERWRTSTAGSY